MSFKLHYTEKGSGEPLILLHGNGEDSSFFNNQIDCFAKFHRVIAVDTRGHGLSPRGDKPFTLDTFAEDLKKLLDSLGISSADILGFSDGGNIAIIFALKYPEYVNKLILNGANLYPSGLKKAFLIPTRAMYALCCIFSPFNKAALRKKELLSLMVKEPNINPRDLQKIKCPTLVIAGTHDLIKAEHTRLIADSIPDSLLRFLKGNHAVARSNSTEYNKAVKNFLTEK